MALIHKQSIILTQILTDPDLEPTMTLTPTPQPDHTMVLVFTSAANHHVTQILKNFNVPGVDCHNS